MVGRQVDKVILFPSKRGSKCGKMDKKEDDERKQYTTSPTKNYDYTAELTYSEPIARATFLQFRYKFQYKYSESDRSTYSLIPDYSIYDSLAKKHLQRDSALQILIHYYWR